MLSKNEIKEIRALGQKKFRDEQGLFVVEGEKLVEEALRSEFEVVRHFRVEEIGEETMARISQLTHPSPALAVLRQPKPQLPQILPGELVLALDGIRDPGNLGTILRIADWFGIRQVLASEDTVELYNPKVVQATMGAIFRVRVHYCDLVTMLRCPVRPGMTEEVKPGMTEEAVPVYGTFLEGDSIYETPLTKGGILVMGSEANGISPEVAATITQKLHIPPYPPDAHTSESLNVAVAAAIACAEFRRRLSSNRLFM
ncbi:MAG: RNA methyltransferase [Bacteroidales bacterium]|nr:RNA methyltransferase [Bacteroidales bacterium]